MAKVLGLGGVFFYSDDPAALAAWYEEWLGMSMNRHEASVFSQMNTTSAGYTVWSPFPEGDDYFKPSAKPFMINLIVDDLAAVLERVEEGGGKRVGEIETYEYGAFGWFLDPEGNKVELWQPES